MFDTAVDAAVAYARHLAAEKSSPPKPAKRKADEAAPRAADGDDADGSPRIKLKFLRARASGAAGAAPRSARPGAGGHCRRRPTTRWRVGRATGGVGGIRVWEENSLFPLR